MKRITWFTSVGVLAVLVGISQTQAETGDGRDIAAWNTFVDRLKEVGAEFLRDNRERDEIDQAKGPLYVAQQLAVTVSSVMAERDLAFPLLRVSATNIHKWGLDGADAKYTGAPLDSEGVYRLSGHLGSARLIAIQAVQTEPVFAAFASLSGTELDVDARGEFTVMIARQRPQGWSGPWLEMDARTTNLTVREYFYDWDSEQPSDMRLVRVDKVSGAAPLTHADSAAVLDRFVDRFDARLQAWLPWLERTRSEPANQLRQLQHTGQGLKNNIYGEGWFDLDPGQALIIELDAPSADMWSFQLGNLWWESIDYINGTGSLNGHQAVAGSDGRYRLIIALEDPGVPNWLNPAEHSRGMIMYRFQNSEPALVPATRLVRLAQLGSVLPADTPTVTPAQRRAEIERRRMHGAVRWAP